MFKDRLKEARVNAGLSQGKLAAMLGISKQTVSDYERGYSEPDVNKIMKIMKCLNIEANFLWQDEMAEPTSEEKTISEAAMRLAALYDELDEHGKELLNIVADLQVKRMKAAEPKAKRVFVYPTAHDSDVFAKYNAKREVAELANQCEEIAYNHESGRE